MPAFGFGKDPGPLRDPEAMCDGCGARGTVGRARRLDEQDEEIELHRFCASCWPEESARLRARWREEDRLAGEAWMLDGAPRPPSRGTSFGAATWHGWLELVELTIPLIRSGQASSEDLARMAREIEESAPSLDGRMPITIRAFLQQYGSAPPKDTAASISPPRSQA